MTNPVQIPDAAVQAVIPHLPLGYEVVALNWNNVDAVCAWCYAKSPFGEYRVTWSFNEVGQKLHYPDGTTKQFDGMGGTARDKAKAAAQADFERRVQECVVAKPVAVATVRRQAYAHTTRIAETYINGEYEAQGCAAQMIFDELRALSAEPAQSPICDKSQTEHLRILQLENALTSILFEDSDKSEQQRMIDRVKARAVLEGAEPAQGEQWQDIKALSELSKLTYAIQHNPNCPHMFLIRLPGKRGSIDLKPYRDQLETRPHETGDLIGSGKTLHEAYMAAIAAPTSEAGR